MQLEVLSKLLEVINLHSLVASSKTTLALLRLHFLRLLELFERLIHILLDSRCRTTLFISNM
jgi:hypothetical protein